MGASTGGWSEVFTITSPGLSGQTGYMQFMLDAKASLAATGATGSAQFQVTGYKDTTQLMINPLWDPGDSDPISTSAQYGNWAIATFGDGESAGKAVNDAVTFAVPFTFGTPFKLGIYAKAVAGMRSSGFVPGIGTATVGFDDGLTWGGISAVYLENLTPVDGYTIVSGSGTDWSDAFDATPSDPADFNGDGAVDGADLGLLLSAWGTPDGDLNGDGTTDGADLGLLLSAWD
jgi:hypothetical protein